MPLTETACRSAKPGAKTRRMFDAKGLYLEVSPAGGRWWRLKYRVAGKEKRLSLGVYPDVSLGKARDKCDEARKLLASGIDPSKHRQAIKAAAVAQDPFLARAMLRPMPHLQGLTGSLAPYMVLVSNKAMNDSALPRSSCRITSPHRGADRAHAQEPA